MKIWRVKAIQEEDLVIYAKRLQSVLNRMEFDGFDFAVEGPGANLVEVNGKVKFLALITGSRDKMEKNLVRAETLVVEEK